MSSLKDNALRFAVFAVVYGLYKGLESLASSRRSPNAEDFAQLRRKTLLLQANAKVAGNSYLRGLPSKLRPELSTGIVRGLVAVVLLLVCAAIGDWPYNFYVFLRIAVSGMMVIALLRMYPRRESIWCVTTGLVALVFNPVAPFRFSKDSWRVMNVVGAIAISALIAVCKKTETEESLPVTIGATVNCPECERLDAEFISVRTRRTLAATEGRPTKALDDKEMEILSRIMSHKTEHVLESR